MKITRKVVFAPFHHDERPVVPRPGDVTDELVENIWLASSRSDVRKRLQRFKDDQPLKRRRKISRPFTKSP